MSKYAKAIAAFMGTISVWGISSIGSGISGEEWFGLVGVIGTTLLTYAVPNTPPSETA